MAIDKAVLPQLGFVNGHAMHGGSGFPPNIWRRHVVWGGWAADPTLLGSAAHPPHSGAARRGCLALVKAFVAAPVVLLRLAVDPPAVSLSNRRVSGP
jgi:hypothetical protein